MGFRRRGEPAVLTNMPKNTPIRLKYEPIKLGIDAHAKWFYLARQMNGATPNLQKMRRMLGRRISPETSTLPAPCDG